MPTTQFRRSGQVTLDGSGYGAIRIAPAGRDWVIQYIAVNVSTTVQESTCVVCADQIGDFYIVDSTRTGSSGDTTDTVHKVQDGHCLYIVWSGGDAGAIATVVYSGDEVW